MNFEQIRRRAEQAWRSTGRATRALLLALVAVTVLSSWLPGRLGAALVLTPNSLSAAALPAILFDGLLVGAAGLQSLFLFGAILLFLNQRALQSLWHRDRRLVLEPLGLLVAVTLVLHFLVVPGRGVALIMDALVLGWLGRDVEARLGTPRMTRLLLLVLVVGGALTLLLLGLSARSYGALLGSHLGLPNGTRALTHALLVAWALPHWHRPLGGLPLTGRHAVWILTGLAVFDLLFSGLAEGARALACIVVARAVIEGGWHPRTWPERLRGFGREVRAGWRKLTQGRGGPP